MSYGNSEAVLHERGHLIEHRHVDAEGLLEELLLGRGVQLLNVQQLGQAGVAFDQPLETRQPRRNRCSSNNWL